MNGIAENVIDESVGEPARPGQPAQRGLVAGTLGLIRSRRAIRWMLVLTDIVALVIAFTAFYLIRVNSGLFTDISGFPFLEVIRTISVVTMFWMALFWFSGVYVNVHNQAFFDEYYSVLKVIFVGCFLLFVAVYVANLSSGTDAESYLLVSAPVYFLLLAGTIGLGRYLVRAVMKRLRQRGIGLRRTIIVGDSPRSRQLLQMFRETPELGFEVIGTVTVNENVATPEFKQFSLGLLSDIDRIIMGRGVEVTVLGMEHDRELVLKLITETSVQDTTIKIIPDLYEIVGGQARAQHLYGMPLIEINPQIMPIWEQHLKRALDVGFSFAVLVIGLPAWIATSLAIKLEDGGPVFYSQERVGLGGRTFMAHKFRSMRPDAEKGGISWTAVNDPRVTRVGRIIRRLYIDEIPQFWNVLIGEMSIVGPRPERPFYVEKYSELLPAYPRRLRVKPGVTGWNQVKSGEIVENLEFVQERIRHDFFYIENMSLRLDIEIILRTIIRSLQRKGQA
jgi:exopolysaccharide biosynthesis polyprenyl glycosylphosphotransferase